MALLDASDINGGPHHTTGFGAVGDEDQSIFGFAGGLPNAFEDLIGADPGRWRR